MDMAYALQLIDGDFRSALKLIGKIRNSFAHDVFGCSFESKKQAQRVRNLGAKLNPMPGLSVGTDVAPAFVFRSALAYIAWYLMSACLKTERRHATPATLGPVATETN